MTDLEKQKLNAAEYAAKHFLKPNQVLGIGGGSTVRKFIDVLAKMKAKNMCVVVDKRNTSYARSNKIKVMPIDSVRKIDLAVDGADGVDKNFNMIKGAGGAAIEHEKLIDSMAKKTVIIIDSTKLKKDLLKLEVPIEIDVWAADFITSYLKKLGASSKLKKEGSKPYRTDHGNYVLNARFRKRYPLDRLEKLIKDIPGVIEVGIFTDIADYVIVGYDKGAKILR